jgi:hypothetical protein
MRNPSANLSIGTPSQRLERSVPKTREVPRTAEDFGVLLALAGWLEVLDDLHGGFCHDLNGRVGSLDGLLQIMQLDGPDDTPVMSYLESEAARLGDSVRILRTLSGKMDAPAEPLLARDLAERALTLHRRHRGLEIQEVTLTAEEEIPPFRASLPRVLRVLLIVLSRAGRDAREAGVRKLEVHAAARGGASITVRWSGDAPWDPASLGPSLEALGALLAVDQGILALGPDSATLTFPALTLGG